MCIVTVRVFLEMKKGEYLAGCASSRYFIGAVEAKAHNFNVSQKHFQIAAVGVNIGALKNIQNAYMQYGLIPKEDYEKALRAYQKYLDEVKTALCTYLIAKRNDVCVVLLLLTLETTNRRCFQVI